MKKTILIALFALIATFVTAQVKQDTAKVKVTEQKYVKFVKLNLDQYTVFLQALEQWKKLSIYDNSPSLTDEKRIKLYKDLEAYQNNLYATMKADSVKIEVPPAVKKK